MIVGWSLGGHIAIEAAPALPEAAGFVVFGTPPVSSAEQLATAFLPNPAMNVGFTAAVSPDEAAGLRGSFVAPGRRWGRTSSWPTSWPRTARPARG